MSGGAAPAATRGSGVALAGVSVTLGGAEIIRDVSIDIGPGEFVCVIGPSGCGKSTLLNAIAGFVDHQGSIAMARGTDAGGRLGHPWGVVFQSSEALFPWLTTRENIEFGPRMRGMGRAERGALAERYMELVGLADHAAKFPGELSGGMRQRVQLARVLAMDPAVVLMDEPFGALDAQTREQMQAELVRIWQEERPTVLFVTHDISEAIRLSDRVLVMSPGPAAGVHSLHTIEMDRPRDLWSPAGSELQRALRQAIYQPDGPTADDG